MMNQDIPDWWPSDENRIIQGDSVEIMKDIPDNSIDLILTDPPYGKSIAKNGSIGGNNAVLVKDYGNQNWDVDRIDGNYIKEMRRTSKNQIIFGGNYYTDYLPPTSCWIVWDKKNTGNFADCELAWASFEKSVRKYEYLWNGMIRKNDEERFHPTQKPLGLFKEILKNYSESDNLVFDPFIGSGTTAVACKKLDRDYLGIDISKKYIKIARERVEKTEPNQTLDEFFGDG